MYNIYQTKHQPVDRDDVIFPDHVVYSVYALVNVLSSDAVGKFENQVVAKLSKMS